MTAEIAIINKQGIALAADSAVTVGRERVWKTANKLFSLSPHNDIGLMIYGGAEFAGLPWETVIKCYRAHIGKQKFSTVDECCNSFVDYLNQSDFNSYDVEEATVFLLFFDLLQQIKKQTQDQKQKVQLRADVEQFIDSRLSSMEEDIILEHLKLKDILKYQEKLLEYAKDYFKIHIPKKLGNKLIRCCYETLKRKVSSNFDTGLVVAGFGSKEFLPVLYNFTIDGRIEGKTRIWKIKEYNFNTERRNSVIIPFAQADMSHLFLEGISVELLTFVNQTYKKLLNDRVDQLIDQYVPLPQRGHEKNAQKETNKKVMGLFHENFSGYRHRLLISPIMNVVASLPKEEMAAMAEAMVELTSLRRKVDSKLESVSGPTDVAVISKGDGFIWIKRKHYFDSTLNADFSKRKQMQIDGDGYGK